MDIHSDPTSIAIQMTHFEKIMLFNQPIWFSAMTMWLSYESHTSYKKNKTTFFSHLIYNHIKNNGWKNELLKKKTTLKDPFYFLDICSPSYCLRKKKKFSKHTGANREIKKKPTN